ncbi:MAG TPA: nuclear transport factor 2 family protein [Xanthobacteraceae bacterium]|nr:nuclear transport factor 2 family protein [Xanthobacteraceae bacterium]
MSSRDEIERVLKDAYAARKRGDVDAILRVFSQDVRFQLAGSADVSPVAHRADGADQFRALLVNLVKTFELLDHKIISMMIDGDGATVHWRGKFRSSVTGETVETELVDVIKLKEGRIASFIEFCDTALAAHLMGQGR